MTRQRDAQPTSYLNAPPSADRLGTIDRDLARAIPAGFAFVASRGLWKPAPHLTLVQDALLDLTFGDERFVILEMPPRHGKSEFATHYYPTWALGRFPDWRVGVTSYGSELAEGWTERSRDLMIEWGPSIFGVDVHKFRRAAGDWRIRGRRGSMRATGVGGSLTGRGFDLLIIDDPIKDAKDALSQTIRDNVWNWYLSTARTRLEPGGRIVVIMTRWHEDDLVGRLLNQGGDRWRRVRLPALAEADDPLGRPEGAALWPARYPVEELEAIRLGSPFWWSALFQQRPQPLGGGIFKRAWFRYYRRDGSAYVLARPDGDKRIPVDLVSRFITIDLAISERTTADYFVASVWGLTRDRDLLLLDVTRDRIGATDQLGFLVSLNERWRPAFLGIESTQYQALLVRQAVQRGLPAREFRPDADKVTRAVSQAARYSTGSVYHPAESPWLAEWESEYLHFPTDAHDDQVDTGSIAAEAVAWFGDGPRVRAA